MSSKILLTLEVGVIILMFRMFYIEIETKNVFPFFDVSKVHLKPCSYARGLFCNVNIILFCVYIAKNKKRYIFHQDPHSV